VHIFAGCAVRECALRILSHAILRVKNLTRAASALLGTGSGRGASRRATIG
jgi:hypothetical protein